MATKLEHAELRHFEGCPERRTAEGEVIDHLETFKVPHPKGGHATTTRCMECGAQVVVHPDGSRT